MKMMEKMRAVLSVAGVCCGESFSFRSIFSLPFSPFSLFFLFLPIPPRDDNSYMETQAAVAVPDEGLSSVSVRRSLFSLESLSFSSERVTGS